ncbi:MAG: hypothetical protein K9L24_02735 [Spirochaetia bacterium]|nr:hypothetical protein [Spirochaetia bacterium]
MVLCRDLHRERFCAWSYAVIRTIGILCRYSGYAVIGTRRGLCRYWSYEDIEVPGVQDSC